MKRRRCAVPAELVEMIIKDVLRIQREEGTKYWSSVVDEFHEELLFAVVFVCPYMNYTKPLYRTLVHASLSEEYTGITTILHYRLYMEMRREI
jgi:hypothetical protein